ncbi:MAG: DUF881 domain-containing protein [Egibacteraceae bacterium]
MFEQEGAKSAEVVRGLRSRVEEVRAVAGLTAVEGPGLQVTLSDSALRQSPTGDPNDLVRCIRNVPLGPLGMARTASAVPDTGERGMSRRAVSGA